jgi:hypothetical protein
MLSAGMLAASVSLSLPNCCRRQLLTCAIQHTAGWDGPRGCLHLSYILGNCGYYFGALRAYPRYWVGVGPVRELLHIGNKFLGF